MWKKEQEKSMSESYSMRKTLRTIIGFEDGRGQEPRNAGRLYKLKRQENRFFLEPLERNSVTLIH